MSLLTRFTLIPSPTCTQTNLQQGLEPILWSGTDLWSSPLGALKRLVMTSGGEPLGALKRLVTSGRHHLGTLNSLVCPVVLPVVCSVSEWYLRQLLYLNTFLQNHATLLRQRKLWVYFSIKAWFGNRKNRVNHYYNYVCNINGNFASVKFLQVSLNTQSQWKSLLCKQVKQLICNMRLFM